MYDASAVNIGACANGLSLANATSNVALVARRMRSCCMDECSMLPLSLPLYLCFSNRSVCGVCDVVGFDVGVG